MIRQAPIHAVSEDAGPFLHNSSFAGAIPVNLRFEYRGRGVNAIPGADCSVTLAPGHQLLPVEEGLPV